MGDSSPDPPKPTDPMAVAGTQQQFNYDAAAAGQAASSTNQVTPWGSLTYEQTGTGPGGMPIYTATTKLNPETQQLLDTLRGQAQSSLTRANYGAQSPSDAIGNLTEGRVKQLLDTQTSYLNPFFDVQTRNLDTKLRNQGLDPSSRAYQESMNKLIQSQNQSVTGFLAQAQPQAYQQASSEYLMPLQTAATSLGIITPNTVTGSLTQTPTTQVQPANFIGANANYNEAQMAAYKAQMDKNSSMMSGLFGIPTAILGGWANGGGVQSLLSGLGGSAAAGGSSLGGTLASAAMLSDRRFKTDIEQIGTSKSGTPIYRFRYIGSPVTQIGFMAQDVEDTVPEAVITLPNGIKMVDYSKATERDL